MMTQYSNLKFLKFNYSYYPELIDKPYEEFRREQLSKNKIKIGMVLKMKNNGYMIVDKNNIQTLTYEDVIEYAYNVNNIE